MIKSIFKNQISRPLLEVNEGQNRLKKPLNIEKNDENSPKIVEKQCDNVVLNLLKQVFPV